ncbi:MAG: hypothetical protein WCT10_00385 [Patescibacteria group bacterium]|jgi:hypothetical protein
MKKFDLKPGESDIRVVATTKAGFLQAALEGAFAVGGIDFAKMTEDGTPPATDRERHFTVEAADFTQILIALLNEALKLAAEKKEAYAGLRLALITDKKVEGDFLGQGGLKLKKEIKTAACSPEGVHKNQLGYWEANIEFRV